MKKGSLNYKISPSKETKLQKRNKRYIHQMNSTSMQEDDHKIKV
jgi:hypothetical protein